MSWSNIPEVDLEAEKEDKCREIDKLTNSVGQFMVLEAKNRGIKDVTQVCTASINLAVKMTAALAALSNSKKAREELANNLSNTFRDGIMDTIKSIDENDELQDLKVKMFSDELAEELKDVVKN